MRRQSDRIRDHGTVISGAPPHPPDLLLPAAGRGRGRFPGLRGPAAAASPRPLPSPAIPTTAASSCPGASGRAWSRTTSGPLRFLTVAPNGDVYVKTDKGGIVALRDTNGDGRADVNEKFGEGGGTGSPCATAGSTTRAPAPSTATRWRPASSCPRWPSSRSSSPAFPTSGSTTPSPSPSARTASSTSRSARPPTPTAGPRTARSGPRARTPTEFLKTHGGWWRFDPSKQNQTQADGLPLLHRPPPHALHRLEPGLQGLLRRADGARQPEHRRSRSTTRTRTTRRSRRRTCSS